MAEKKADILESLKEQLRKKQADISVFKDLLEDSASGKATIVKQNQSVKDLVAVNKQMLMILDKLELTTKETIKGDDDDEL